MAGFLSSCVLLMEETETGHCWWIDRFGQDLAKREIYSKLPSRWVLLKLGWHGDIGGRYSQRPKWTWIFAEATWMGTEQSFETIDEGIFFRNLTLKRKTQTWDPWVCRPRRFHSS